VADLAEEAGRRLTLPGVLVARGMSNKQIAERLVITPKTAADSRDDI
jgi:FixJ family two-component response regulator